MTLISALQTCWLSRTQYTCRYFFQQASDSARKHVCRLYITHIGNKQMAVMHLMLCRNYNTDRLNDIQAGCCYVHGLYCKVFYNELTYLLTYLLLTYLLTYLLLTYLHTYFLLTYFLLTYFLLTCLLAYLLTSYLLT